MPQLQSNLKKINNIKNVNVAYSLIFKINNSIKDAYVALISFI